MKMRMRMRRMRSKRGTRRRKRRRRRRNVGRPPASNPTRSSLPSTRPPSMCSLADTASSTSLNSTNAKPERRAYSYTSACPLGFKFEYNLPTCSYRVLPNHQGDEYFRECMILPRVNCTKMAQVVPFRADW